MLTVELRISWEILCQNPSKVWLALPIETTHQKIIQINTPKKIKKKIKKELYHYIYLETYKKERIQSKIILELNKISKYKDDFNNRFLKNNKILRIEKIKPLAIKLKTPRKFYKWIIKNIKFPRDLSKYLKNLNWTETAPDVLIKREGECAGKSLLFVSLCRAIGIPARIVSGYFLKSGQISLFNAKFNKESLELHQWAEFFDKGYWIPVDCSLAQEEGKEYFGKFDDYRVVISKDVNLKLIRDGIIPFLQIGEIRPKEFFSNIVTKITFSFKK